MKSRAFTWLLGFGTPMAAIILAFPFYNRLEPNILGYPFVYGWFFIWILLTAACMMLAFRIDPYNKPEATAAAEKRLEQVLKELPELEKKLLAGSKEGGES